VIGQDDVIEEGARPDAPPPGAETGPETPPRITLNEEIGNRSNAPAGEDGENGISGNGPDSDEAVNAIEESEGAVANDTPNEPRLQNTNPDGLLLPDLRRRANSIVEENLADSRRQAASGRRPGAPGAGDETPDFSTEEPTILSDTRGYDFGPYMNQVVNRVRYNWYSLIPEAARFRQLRGRVVIIFTITKTGIVADERIVADSGSLPLDRAALSSILASNPFPPIPDDFDGDSLVLQFTFLYNVS
jgi:TonB family protein